MATAHAQALKKRDVEVSKLKRWWLVRKRREGTRSTNVTESKLACDTRREDKRNFDRLYLVCKVRSLHWLLDSRKIVTI